MVPVPADLFKMCQPQKPTTMAVKQPKDRHDADLFDMCQPQKPTTMVAKQPKDRHAAVRDPASSQGRIFGVTALSNQYAGGPASSFPYEAELGEERIIRKATPPGASSRAPRFNPSAGRTASSFPDEAELGEVHSTPRDNENGMHPYPSDGRSSSNTKSFADGHLILDETFNVSSWMRRSESEDAAPGHARFPSAPILPRGLQEPFARPDAPSAHWGHKLNSPTLEGEEPRRPALETTLPVAPGSRQPPLYGSMSPEPSPILALTLSRCRSPYSSESPKPTPLSALKAEAEPKRSFGPTFRFLEKRTRNARACVVSIARGRYRLLTASKYRVCTSVSNFVECVSSDPLHNGGHFAPDYELESPQHLQAPRQALPPGAIDDDDAMRRAQVCRSFPLRSPVFLLPLPLSSHLSVPRSSPSALCAATRLLVLFLSCFFFFICLCHGRPHLLLWAATRRVCSHERPRLTDELGHISWMANPFLLHVFVMQKGTDWCI
jgi:hypothetical protein